MKLIWPLKLCKWLLALRSIVGLYPFALEEKNHSKYVASKKLIGWCSFVLLFCFGFVTYINVIHYNYSSEDLTEGHGIDHINLHLHNIMLSLLSSSILIESTLALICSRRLANLYSKSLQVSRSICCQKHEWKPYTDAFYVFMSTIKLFTFVFAFPSIKWFGGLVTHPHNYICKFEQSVLPVWLGCQIFILIDMLYLFSVVQMTALKSIIITIKESFGKLDNSDLGNEFDFCNQDPSVVVNQARPSLTTLRSGTNKMQLRNNTENSIALSTISETLDVVGIKLQSLMIYQDGINSYFSYPVTVIVCLMMASLIIIFFMISSYIYLIERFIFTTVLFMIWCSVNLAEILFTADIVYDQIQNLKRILLVSQLKVDDKIVLRKITNLISVVNGFPDFNMGRLFTLSKARGIQILSFISLYVVILHQFKLSERHLSA